jgi:hypothetical protein
MTLDQNTVAVTFSKKRKVPPVVRPILMLGIFFGVGFLFGLPTLVLLTHPTLLVWGDFVGVPCGLVAVLVLYWLGFPLFRPDINDYAVLGFWARGIWAWVVCAVALATFASGVVAGGKHAGGELEVRVAQAPPAAATPATDAPPTAPGNLHVATGDPAHVATGEPIRVASLTMRLTSIYYNQDIRKSSAVIDGQSLMVGDNIGAWKVKTIDAKQVTLQDGSGQVNRLALPEP